ncbi:hypothetical protein [Chamaesiphon sp. VAR_69_metabat_338]|uniref:hypothetical protein n=1 Tax=Chamaesiphon sp. VAR_69_metabat_338 TaxID=2964704 RepID=UPI00286E1BE6|nr:hypothetical protein [Chamaesiphon sp. VAR_69_metabat_338]
MNTMAQIDALYEAKINNAKLEGELQGEAKGEERQKQSIALNLLPPRNNRRSNWTDVRATPAIESEWLIRSIDYNNCNPLKTTIDN